MYQKIAADMYHMHIANDELLKGVAVLKVHLTFDMAFVLFTIMLTFQENTPKKPIITLCIYVLIPKISPSGFFFLHLLKLSILNQEKQTLICETNISFLRGADRFTMYFSDNSTEVCILNKFLTNPSQHWCNKGDVYTVVPNI